MTDAQSETRHLRIEPRLWQQAKIQAAKEGIAVYLVVAKALGAYLAWCAKKEGQAV